MQAGGAGVRPVLREVLPAQGVTFVERSLSEVLCKPKILPLKSAALEKVEKIEKESAIAQKSKRVGTSLRS
jgi:BBSome-interacting protein 1